MRLINLYICDLSFSPHKKYCSDLLGEITKEQINASYKECYILASIASKMSRASLNLTNLI